MKKNSFYVLEIVENETGRTMASARKVANCYNLVGLFTPARGYSLLSVNACDTWTEAEKIARFWNDCAREKGLCMF